MRRKKNEWRGEKTSGEGKETSGDWEKVEGKSVKRMKTSDGGRIGSQSGKCDQYVLYSVGGWDARAGNVINMCSIVWEDGTPERDM